MVTSSFAGVLWRKNIIFFFFADSRKSLRAKTGGRLLIQKYAAQIRLRGRDAETDTTNHLHGEKIAEKFKRN